MNFLELVKSRYSVRGYLQRGVEPEKLEYILQCARVAPSACNRQPWRIIVLRDTEARQSVAESASRFGWLNEAPLLLVVVADDSQAWHRGCDGRNHADIDAAIITEHIVLAATEQGLGSCWVCAFDVEQCHKALSLGNNERAVAIIPIGYASGEPSSRPRKEIEQIVDFR